MRERAMTKKEKNLARLRKCAIPMNFVKKNDGVWDHDRWEEFCKSLKKKGYTPIDEDQVGLVLEEKKTVYLAKK